MSLTLAFQINQAKHMGIGIFTNCLAILSPSLLIIQHSKTRNEQTAQPNIHNQGRPLGLKSTSATSGTQDILFRGDQNML